MKAERVLITKKIDFFFLFIHNVIIITLTKLITEFTDIQFSTVYYYSCYTKNLQVKVALLG